MREVLGATVGSLGVVLAAAREVAGHTVGSLHAVLGESCFGCCKGGG